MWYTDNQSALMERTHDKNAYMDQLHKNRFQVAKHRPGLNVKAELLLKITAEGDLESKRETVRGTVLLLVGSQTRVHECVCDHTFVHKNTHTPT